MRLAAWQYRSCFGSQGEHPEEKLRLTKNSPKKGVRELEDEGRGSGNGSCYKGGKKRKQQLKAQEARIVLQNPRQ